jgi:DNA repair exonuclease SbcCD nuclease subunit
LSNFKFLHTADIHLDSPLHGLARYEGVPTEEVRRATRSAFDNLIETALTENVDFVIVAGDLFDGDWRDMGTGLYFARAMGRLAQAGIPAYVLKGNHDAQSVITRDLPWPETVKVFSARKPETFLNEELGVALHGQSFATAHVTDDLAAGYPAPASGLFNIGVLHTAVAGHPEHAPYAPCSIAELVAKGYDYWALGHVHDHQVLNREPWIVFPGNLQGRNVRETGAKGAVLVEVADRSIVAVEHVPLDVIRWLRAEVVCEGAEDVEGVHARVRQALAGAYAEGANGRPAVARVVLTGATSLHGVLQDRQGRLRDEVRALALQEASEFWIEKVVVRTMPPTTASAPLPGLDDLEQLLEEARTSPELATELARNFQLFLTKVPPDAEPDGLHDAARKEEWVRLLEAGAAALRTRLSASGAA